MRPDFNLNTWEATVYIDTDVVIEPFVNSQRVQSCIGTFTASVCDLIGTKVPMIAYGDYAKKLKEYLPKGSKATLWANAHQFRGQLCFRVNKVVLEKYPKEMSDDAE